MWLPNKWAYLKDLKDIIDNYFSHGKKREATMTGALLIENLKAILLIATPDRKYISTDDNEWGDIKV
jgi:hypothetical protein